MRFFYYLTLIAIVILGAGFATLNQQAATLNYYFDQTTMSLALLLALTFAAGCIFGLIVGLWFLMKHKFKHFRLRKRLTVVEKELENLRTIPLREKI